MIGSMTPSAPSVPRLEELHVNQNQIEVLPGNLGARALPAHDLPYLMYCTVFCPARRDVAVAATGSVLESHQGVFDTCESLKDVALTQ